MTAAWYSLVTPAPAGFEYHDSLSRAELRGGPVALFAVDLPSVRTILQGLEEKLTGVVVTWEAQFVWNPLGRTLFHLGVPSTLRPHLPDILPTYLDLIAALRAEQDIDRALHLEMDRSVEDRRRLAADHARSRQALISDISERRQVEAALRESEEKFHTVFETIPDVVTITRLRDNVVVDLNPAILELTGIPREKFIGRTPIDMKAWADPDDRARIVQRVLTYGSIRNVEAQLNSGSGEPRDCLFSARLMEMQGELHMLMVIKDITERKRVEEALRQSEATFRKLFSESSDAILLIDGTGVFVECNQAALDLLKMTRQQFLLLPPDRISPEFQPDGRRSAESAPEMISLAYSKGLHRFDWTCVNAGGGEFIVEVSLMPIVINGQTMLHTTWRDITGRKLVEKALQESETRFRQIFEMSPDPLIIGRADGALINVNRAFVVNTGIPAEEAIGKNGMELNLWADFAQRDEFLRRLKQDGEVVNLETRFRMRDGEIRTGLTSASMIATSDGPCMLIDIRDITRQKQAEAVLMEMDRMKSEFISTAAHELRTPLSVILGYTELLLSPDAFGGFNEERKAEFLDEIYLKCETLSQIIDEMLDISRIESGQPIALDLQPHAPAAWLGKVIRRFELQGGQHVFILGLDTPQPEALICDLHRMTQVLENLLSNAIKYSPCGGTITVRGSNSGDDYVVTVIDQGIGMTPEQQARIFDKFYRADASNTAIGGLGLGMSIARQIVENHGGRIWVESNPGAGTQVSFSLPLVRE